MDPWSREALKEVLDLTRENNTMLRKIRNNQRWAFVYRVLYLLVIFGIPVAGYYYLKPYFGTFLDTYNKTTGYFDSFSELPSAQGLKDALIKNNPLKK